MSSNNLQVLNFTVAFDPVSGSLYMIGTPLSFDVPVKEGPPPASEAAIHSLPMVKIEETGLECSICLEEFEVGEEAKEMIKCEHKFHSGCLEKWLRVNGSCPVCRCKVPVVEERPRAGKAEEEERGEMRIRFVNGEMVIDL